MKKIVLSFYSQHGRRVEEGAKWLFGFYVKKKKSCFNKKTTERRTGLTKQRRNKRYVSFLRQYFVSTLFAFDRFPVSK